MSRREAHDSSAFYLRFSLPEVSDDDRVEKVGDLGDGCFEADARHMVELPDNSVALVVTSPPYFAGKEYEEALGQGGVPATYADYLELLHDVFAECKRVLEPGGRIAVNVANLGRKPYRSLSADVVHILEHDLKLLLRGEVIWQKGEGASGNCAWGSFRSAANPVLRDVTERVIVASKGRFDRARTPQQRRDEGLPWESTLTSDEFMEATLDVWTIEPESARRVSHPAPFPVELPERLVHLYTYRGDVVLDPFMGSGSALVAAARTGRRGVGYDVDPTYVAIARDRVDRELRRRHGAAVNGSRAATAAALAPANGHLAPGLDEDGAESFQARATTEGKAAPAIARRVLEEAGFTVTHSSWRLPGLGVRMSFVAADADGGPWYFDVAGASFATTRGGLRRTDTVWKSLGRAHVVQSKANRGRTDKVPLVFLTSHLPDRGSEGDVALRAAGPGAFFDAVEMLSREGQRRLAAYAAGTHRGAALPGFWTANDLAELA